MRCNFAPIYKELVNLKQNFQMPFVGTARASLSTMSWKTRLVDRGPNELGIRSSFHSKALSLSPPLHWNLKSQLLILRSTLPSGLMPFNLSSG